MKCPGWSADAAQLFAIKDSVPSWVTTADYFYVSLHVGDSEDLITTDDQTETEVTYSGYARQQISRDAADWTYVPAGLTEAYYKYDYAVTFPAPPASPPEDTASTLGIGLSATGTGTLLAVSEWIGTPSPADLTLEETIIIPVGQLRIFEL